MGAPMMRPSYDEWRRLRNNGIGADRIYEGSEPRPRRPSLRLSAGGRASGRVALSASIDDRVRLCQALGIV